MSGVTLTTRRYSDLTVVNVLVKADLTLIQEAWYRLQGWYKAAVERAPPPT